MAGGHARPLLVIERPRFEGLAARVRTPQIGDDDDVLTAEFGSECGDRLGLLPGPLELVIRLVETGEYRAAGEFESPRAELLAQLLGIRRQVAVGAELDPGVSRLDDFIEEALPGDLSRVVWQPHAPGVGCCADAK